MKTEKEFVDELEKRFLNYFEVQREVWSECKTSRIDMLLSVDGKYHFGLECKKPDKKRGEEIGRYIQQAHRYTQLKWMYRNDIYVHVPIFICPPLSYKYFLLNEQEITIDGKDYHADRHHKLHKHHTMNGFLSAWDIGEVRNTELGYQFSMANKPYFEYKAYGNTVFSEVHMINYNTYINKLCKK